MLRSLLLRYLRCLLWRHRRRLLLRHLRNLLRKPPLLFYRCRLFYHRRALCGQHGKRQRCEHKDDCRDGSEFAQKACSASATEKCLAGAAKSSAYVCTLSFLEQDNSNKKQAHQHMKYYQHRYHYLPPGRTGKRMRTFFRQCPFIVCIVQFLQSCLPLGWSRLRGPHQHRHTPSRNPRCRGSRFRHRGYVFPGQLLHT